MRNEHVYGGARIAGFLVLAMPVLDSYLSGGPAGPLHALVSVLGFVLIAIGAGPDPAR